MTREAICARCRYFLGGPDALERAFKGLSALSSGYASVCMDDGLCTRHDRHVTARAWCVSFVARDQKEK